MSISLGANGGSYSYPQENDPAGWGDDATNWASAVSAALSNIGLGGTVNPKALIDMTVTNSKGFLPPKLTTAERNAIATPPAGLVIYNTTTSQLEVYTGSSWFSVASNINGNLTVNGNSTLNGTLTVTGTTSLVSVTGTNATFTGNTTFGDATSDTTAVTGILNVDSGVLYVDPTNNRVGINTSTPTVPLDVVGNMNVSGVFNQMPVGTIITSALKSAPSGFLLCDGSNTVSRTTYANLFSAIVPNNGTVTITIATPGVVTLNSHGFLTGESIYLTTTGALPTGLSVDTLYYVVVNDANSFWLATSYANAIANTRITTSGTQSGTHTLFYCPYGLGSTTSNFKLPDQKNAVFRGRGLSTGFTSNGTTRMGYLEDDQMQGHIHNVADLPYIGNSAPGGPDANGYGSTTKPTTSPISDGTNGTPRTGNETRMKNQGVNFFIKF